MAEIFRTRYGVRVVILSNDHTPPHVHVSKAECHAKIVIGTWEILEVEGFSEKDVRRIIEEMKLRQTKLEERWNEIQKDKLR